MDKGSNEMERKMKRRRSKKIRLFVDTLANTPYIMVILIIFGGALHAEDVFDQECVQCHTAKKISLRKTFMNALLVYSGKENMKAGLKYYLRHPRRDSSVMSEVFLNKYGLIEPLRIDEKRLDEALDIYWRRYTVYGKLQ
jgi:hypothetical protein